LATSLRASLLAALLAALVLSFARTGSASGQGLTVTDDGAESLFPNGIQFRVSAQSSQTVERVRLRYTVVPDDAVAAAVPDFQPSAAVSAGLILGADFYLPPGTRIRYHWEVTDEAGESAETPEATIVYEDVRFDWKSLEANEITVHYYSGSEEDAQAMLDVARDAVAQASDLLNAEVEFPLNVRIYASRDDMRPALERRSESYESRIITAGVRVSPDTVLVLGEVSFSTLRHELTHVVTAVAGEGPIGKLPAWLDEGTAVYGQDDPEEFGDAVQRAVDRGNVLSVRSITSYQGDPDKVNLFYGQSWALVSFLIDTYGQEKFAQLFAEIKSGKSTDAAMEAVYGFDQDGLDNEWRASVGLPPREGTDGGQEPSPTFPASNGGNSSANEDGGGPSAGLLIGLGAAILAAAAVIAVATWAVARRFR